jgi:hypothetical protein
MTFQQTVVTLLNLEAAMGRIDPDPWAIERVADAITRRMASEISQQAHPFNQFELAPTHILLPIMQQEIPHLRRFVL